MNREMKIEVESINNSASHSQYQRSTPYKSTELQAKTLEQRGKARSLRKTGDFSGRLMGDEKLEAREKNEANGLINAVTRDQAKQTPNPGTKMIKITPNF